MTRITLLSALSSLLLLASAAPVEVEDPILKAFHGQGHILVLGTDNLRNASRADRIGCLNEQGLVTLNDCAVFTRREDSPNVIWSSKGLCSFRDNNMPQNTDSVYGRDSHAWSCGSMDGKSAENIGEVYWTAKGFNYPFVCNGNLNCYYDIKAPPADEKTAAVIWQFFWGSQQVDVAPGHLKVMWLWDPVKVDSATWTPIG